MKLFIWINTLIIYAFFALIIWINYPDEIKTLFAKIEATDETQDDSEDQAAEDGTVYDVIKSVKADLARLQLDSLNEISQGRLPIFFTDSFDLTLDFELARTATSGFKLAVLEAGAEVTSEATDTQSITLHFKTPLHPDVRAFISASCDPDDPFWDPNLVGYCESNRVDIDAGSGSGTGPTEVDVSEQEVNDPLVSGLYFLTFDEYDIYRRAMAQAGTDPQFVGTLLKLGKIKLVETAPNNGALSFTEFLQTDAVVYNETLIEISNQSGWNGVSVNDNRLSLSYDVIELNQMLATHGVAANE